MHNRKKLISIVLLLVLIAAGAGFSYLQSSREVPPLRLETFKLNTSVTISIYDSRDSSLLKGCQDLLDHYEDLFSRTSLDSELYKLNHGEITEVSPETAELIQAGLQYSALSKGAFDLTIAPVSSLWDFTSGEKIIPPENQIQKNLALVDYQKVQLSGNQVLFEAEGMGIDLGALAKGYIADRIKDYLKDQGVNSALIDLGGNILCLGEKTEGTPFVIGVRKPFGNRNEALTTLEVRDQSVVSSGSYERYFELDGHLYHHILDPSTGYPYDNGLVGVTILSDSSLVGDALSTVCFALGLEKGMELLNSLPQVEGIFVTEDFKLHYSADFPR